MTRTALLHCLPWLALLAGLVIVLVLIVRFGGGRVDLRRLRRLHQDQGGGVQSLSFVLTLPVFVWVMLMIVQVSQLMIGTIVVHYAAQAAARAAIVWIPAKVGEDFSPEQENRISTRIFDPEATDQVFPILDPTSDEFGPTEGGVTYLVEPGSSKYDKIASAAILACVPISPSKDYKFPLSSEGQQAAELMYAAYTSLAPSSTANRAISLRLQHKMAYAMAATQVEIRFYHPNFEPPLICYEPPDGEFQDNELGWQDPITVKVTHQFALLPGPGRLLAWIIRRSDGTLTDDKVAQRISKQGDVYVYPITASATLGNEGEKSVMRYEYQSY
jgi:hypothetical protein